MRLNASKSNLLGKIALTQAIPRIASNHQFLYVMYSLSSVRLLLLL